MKCLVNWIQLNTHVRLENTHPCLKGGPLDFGWFVPLGNVTLKYFSKLRFGTSKIQPDLKCLQNILLSFYESLLQARLWEHELFSIRSIEFISTVVKSPNKACNKYKVFCIVLTRGCYIGDLVSTALTLRHKNPVFEQCRDRGNGQHSTSYFNLIFTKWSHVRFESWVDFRNESISKIHVQFPYNVKA